MANIYLYHGSNQTVENPRCDVGAKGRDFGVCFYTTYDRNTAVNWAKKNYKDHAVLNKYSIDLERLTDGGLKVKRFNADAEWARFVWSNRFDTKYKRPDYDIIIGPMADRGLKEQFMKLRTEDLSFENIAPLIHYDRFKSLQICFCSSYAISVLNYLN